MTSDGTVWGIVLFWCKSKDLWSSLWPLDYKWCNSDVVRSAWAGSENVSLMPQLCWQGRWKPQVSGCRHVKEEGRLWEQQVCQSPCQGSEKLHSRNCMWACQALLHGATSAFTRLPVLLLKLQVREIFYLSLWWKWKGPVAFRVPYDAQHWPISCVFTTSWISSFKTVSVASLLSWTEGSPDCHFMWIHGSDFEMQETSCLLLLNFAISARCKGLDYHIQNVCLNIPDANALVGMWEQMSLAVSIESCHCSWHLSTVMCMPI